MTSLSKAKRFAILERDGFRCRYCKAIDVPLAVDHILPRALGGTDDAENLAACCQPCNTGKGKTPLGHFKLPRPTKAPNHNGEAARWRAKLREVERERDALHAIVSEYEVAVERRQVVMESGSSWTGTSTVMQPRMVNLDGVLYFLEPVDPYVNAVP